ncbi:MAG: hypothetical protein KAT00_12420, partial [Planctomycetes bacterium]|nr:hypothetical protein [Planctomycetota bacterium]
PVVPPAQFLTLDIDGYDIASDEYLWLVGQAGRGLRGEITVNQTRPDRTVELPGPASNPSPNGASGVSVDADLSWTAGNYAESHDVYFGTDPTPDAGEFQGNQAGTTFDPGTLDHNTTYYWAVDEVNAAGTTESPVWSFTTVLPPETDPPTPNPATFAAAPAADSDTAISMTATTGSDPSGPVEYLFTETSGNPGGTSSPWQTSVNYTDSGLNGSTQYTYTVTIRDGYGNAGTASSPANATTDVPPPDTDPPTPDPATFATAPYATGIDAIAMVATTGSDASGPVEYLFTETSGNPGGTSSSWQTSTSYTDSGLNASTQYTYTVTMRDAYANTGTASSGASATTESSEVLLEQNDNQSDKVDVKDGQEGAQSFEHGGGSDPDY